MILELENRLHTVYYIVGAEKELRDAQIVNNQGFIEPDTVSPWASTAAWRVSRRPIRGCCRKFPSDTGR